MPRLSIVQLGYFVITCWDLWKQRNEKVWNNKNPLPAIATMNRARNFLREWRMAVRSSVEGANQTLPEVVNWAKPQHGFLKMNVDAAINKENARMGFGCVIRDEEGLFVAAKEFQKMGQYTPREAEAAAIREALSWIKDLHLDNVHVETDSLIVVQSLNSSTGESSFHLLVQDIKNLLSSFSQVFLSFAKRPANRAAHLVAKQSVSRSDCLEWFSNPPPYLCNVLYSDLC